VIDRGSESADAVTDGGEESTGGPTGGGDESVDAATDRSRGRVAGSPWLVVYLKGFCMGAADAVPGVSGGTIALITGIYGRLIAALTAISPRRIVGVLRGVLPGRFDEAVAAFRAVDGPFLLALGTGVLTAVVTVTRLIDAAIEAVPVLTFGFFFGLIGASAVVLWEQVTVDTPGRAAAAVAGFLLAFVASGQAAAAFGTGGPVVFVAGAVAVSAMILPGVSGSLLLIILGQYEYMVGRLRAFVDAALAVVTGGEPAAVIDPGITVTVFVSGAVVGLFSVAHVVRWALETRRRATLAFLVSLIVGALRAPVVRTGQKLAESGGAWTPEVIAVFGGAAVVGAAGVVALDRYAGVVETGVTASD